MLRVNCKKAFLFVYMICIILTSVKWFQSRDNSCQRTNENRKQPNRCDILRICTRNWVILSFSSYSKVFNQVNFSRIADDRKGHTYFLDWNKRNFLSVQKTVSEWVDFHNRFCYHLTNVKIFIIKTSSISLEPNAHNILANR